MQNFNIFDLEVFFANLIKNILALSVVKNNYSMEIICIYIFFCLVIKFISYAKIFNIFIQSSINNFFCKIGKKYKSCAVLFKSLFFYLLC